MANTNAGNSYGSELRKLILNGYKKSEFETLCDDLGINYDTLRGEQLEDRIADLIRKMSKRKDGLEQLIACCRKDRPPAENWPDVPENGLNSFELTSESGRTALRVLKWSLGAGLVVLAVGILGKLLSTSLQGSALTDAVSAALLIGLTTAGAMVIGAALAGFISNQQAAPNPNNLINLFKQQSLALSWLEVMQMTALLFAVVLLAWQLANLAQTATGSSLWAIGLIWLALGIVPLGVALMVQNDEGHFRKTLSASQQRGLTAEKLFGAFLTAFIGQSVALSGLLILDTYMGLWSVLPAWVRGLYWMLAGILTMVLCLKGTQVAVLLWRNRIKDDAQTAPPMHGTLLLAVAFPLFVYPAFGFILLITMPYLRNPWVGVPVLLGIVFWVGREALLDKDDKVSDNKSSPIANSPISQLILPVFFVAVPLLIFWGAKSLLNTVAMNKVHVAVAARTFPEAQQAVQEAYRLAPGEVPRQLREALVQSLNELAQDSNADSMARMPRIAQLYRPYADSEPREQAALTMVITNTLCQAAVAADQLKLTHLFTVVAILNPAQAISLSLELNDTAVSFLNGQTPQQTSAPDCWSSPDQVPSMTVRHARAFLESVQSIDDVLYSTRTPISKSIMLSNLGVVRELATEQPNFWDDAATAYREALHLDASNLPARYRLASLLLWYASRFANRNVALQQAVDIADQGWRDLGPACSQPPADSEARRKYAYCIQLRATAAGARVLLGPQRASEAKAILAEAITDYEHYQSDPQASYLPDTQSLDDRIGGEVYYWQVKAEMAQNNKPNLNMICRGLRTSPSTPIREQWLGELKDLFNLLPGEAKCLPPE